MTTKPGLVANLLFVVGLIAVTVADGRANRFWSDGTPARESHPLTRSADAVHQNPAALGLNKRRYLKLYLGGLGGDWRHQSATDYEHTEVTGLRSTSGIPAISVALGLPGAFAFGLGTSERRFAHKMSHTQNLARLQSESLDVTDVLTGALAFKWLDTLSVGASLAYTTQTYGMSRNNVPVQGAGFAEPNPGRVGTGATTVKDMSIGSAVVALGVAYAVPKWGVRFGATYRPRFYLSVVDGGTVVWDGCPVAQCPAVNESGQSIRFPEKYREPGTSQVSSAFLPMPDVLAGSAEWQGFHRWIRLDYVLHFFWKTTRHRVTFAYPEGEGEGNRVIDAHRGLESSSEIRLTGGALVYPGLEARLGFGGGTSGVDTSFVTIDTLASAQASVLLGLRWTPDFMRSIWIDAGYREDLNLGITENAGGQSASRGRTLEFSFGFDVEAD